VEEETKNDGAGDDVQEDQTMKATAEEAAKKDNSTRASVAPTPSKPELPGGSPPSSVPVHGASPPPPSGLPWGPAEATPHSSAHAPELEHLKKIVLSSAIAGDKKSVKSDTATSDVEA